MRPPKRISAVYLRRVTTYYLERYSSSRANLRRLLAKRVRRAADHHGDPVEEGMVLVEAELDRLEEARLLDDARYAADRARSLHRRGASTRKIRSVLRAKGVQSVHIDVALDALGADDGDLDLAAARIYARKRRLGPFGDARDDPVRRRRDLARLGRAGFSYDTARRVIEGL